MCIPVLVGQLPFRELTPWSTSVSGSPEAGFSPPQTGGLPSSWFKPNRTIGEIGIHLKKKKKKESGVHGLTLHLWDVILGVWKARVCVYVCGSVGVCVWGGMWV